MKKLLVIFNLLIGLNLIAQQNLIPNPSFESYVLCPDGLGNLHYSNDWFSPLLSTTPDYYHRCSSENSTSVPSNWQGEEQPFSGDAYAGFYGFIDNTSEWMEYISCKILSPLESGKCYRISFYLSLSDSSCASINNIGVLFSNDSIADSIQTYLFSANKIELSTMINNIDGWEQLNYNYTAIGGEEFLTIGNFNSNGSTIHTITNSPCLNVFSYYYIDLVELYECNASSGFIPNVFTPDDDGINDYVDFTQFIGEEVLLINRWGEIVFKMGDQENYFWFGEDFEGENLSSGVYYYLIQSTTETIKTGSIHLVR